MRWHWSLAAEGGRQAMHEAGWCIEESGWGTCALERGCELVGKACACDGESWSLFFLVSVWP